MKTTHADFMRFFENWLFYQFDRRADVVRNARVLSTVSRIVENDDALQEWAARDAWSLYDLASKTLAAQSIK
jgi:hypothetical protein